jgi:hypothetical protein
MINLEELNLSVLRFDDFEDVHLLEVPQTLEKLHLRYGYYDGIGKPSIEMTKSFLNVFKSQIRSFTLIVIKTEKEFSNFVNLQSLVSNFTRLQTFQYDIRTKYQPDSRFPNVEQLPDFSYSIFTLPRLQPFDTKTSRRATLALKLDSDLKLQDLYHCNTLELTPHSSVPTTFELKDDVKFVNLKKIQFNSSIEQCTPEVHRFLSKVITLSPNLNTLGVYTGQAKAMIQHLKSFLSENKASKRILRLECKAWWSGDSYVKTFFCELSSIVPNLKSLALSCAIQFMGEYSTTPSTLIEELRINFRNSTHLKLRMTPGDDISRRLFANCRKELEKIQQQRENSVYYTIERGQGNYYLNIWL